MHETTEILARDAARLGVVVGPGDGVMDEAEQEQALMEALDLGVEAVGLGV